MIISHTSKREVCFEWVKYDHFNLFILEITRASEKGMSWRMKAQWAHQIALTVAAHRLKNWVAGTNGGTVKEEEKEEEELEEEENEEEKEEDIGGLLEELKIGWLLLNVWLLKFGAWKFDPALKV